MARYFSVFENFTFTDFIDIFLVTLLMYNVYVGAAKTRALPVLQGFLIIIAVTVLAALFQLEILSTILTSIVSLMLLAVVILFPAEIKQALYRIGSTLVLTREMQLEKDSINMIVNAVKSFKKDKIGCLIVLQRRDSLLSLQTSGTQLQAKIDKNLLYAIFQKQSPIHDGAVLISRNKIIAFGCYIPNLSYKTNLTEKLGTRHRSALGLSEQSDALIVIVSEETGAVSLAERGGLSQSLGLETLRRSLKKNFLPVVGKNS